ncbi:MAG: hypothetical protein M3464_05990 [Chloroflexota bacterium]|nr:hypothetical protein [Chloroflexota bacterium]
MVSDPGTPAGPARLRPLNLPRPARVLVHAASALPALLIEDGRRLRVERIQDSWDVDEEWWRDRLSRRYYQLVLDDGSLRTVYQDLITGAWYQQHY